MATPPNGDSWVKIWDSVKRSNCSTANGTGLTLRRTLIRYRQASLHAGSRTQGRFNLHRVIAARLAYTFPTPLPGQQQFELQGLSVAMGLSMPKLIETLAIGPSWAGHSRSIITARGFELWHELQSPWNPFEKSSESVTLYLDRLPAVKPDNCKMCECIKAYYSDKMLPVIIWEGAESYRHALQWIRSNRTPDSQWRTQA